MADSMQPKRLNINNNIDQSKTVLDSNEIFNTVTVLTVMIIYKCNYACM